MSVTNPIYKVALQVGTEVLVRTGPGLARIAPLRRAAVWAGERYLQRARATEYARGSYPPGVIDDHTAMELAIVHMVERLLARPLAPAARRAMIDNLLRGALLEQGYRDPVDRFAAEHGTGPAGLLLISSAPARRATCAAPAVTPTPARQQKSWTGTPSIASSARPRRCGARASLPSVGASRSPIAPTARASWMWPPGTPIVFS